ncbi:hypothetical protein HDV00_008427 [Rhizophlyctis rosea]|nr:hypothetical protein HDV00_008427 [Rhizophlyctis rosea]
MDAPRTHQITFTIPAVERTAASNWVNSVKSFFATTAAQAADPARSFMPVPTRGPGAASNFMGIGVPANAPTSINGGPSGGMVGMATTPIVQLEDVLEGLTVHYTVQLISLLGHYLEQIRIQSVHLLFQLATIFDKKVNEQRKKLEKITLAFQTDDKGYYSAVHELFHHIGPSLSMMVVAVVAGLEIFHTCPDWTARGICNSALARLVFENEKIFLEEDQLAAIWNLFFSISSIPLISKIFPDRIVIIKALGLLAPLYSLADTALTYRIVDTLMRLKGKTVQETDAIKGTLKKIFEKLSERATSGDQTAAGMYLSHIELKVVVNDNQSVGEGYSLFMNLINPNDEYAYDLLPWSLETYTISLLPNPPATSKQKKVPVKEFAPLTDFIQSLDNHFRATPALVRYGACVSLHSSLMICPTLVADHKDLYIYVVNGALDTDYLSAFLYLSMLESIKMPEGVSLKDAISKFRHVDYDSLHYDAIYCEPVERSTSMIQLSDILDLAVKGSPPLANKTLHRLATSLEYLNKSMKLKQMETIRLWGSKSEKFDTFLMQTLVPYLNTPDEDIQMATIGVLHALVPSFKTASPADITFAWSYFHALLDSKIKSAVLNLIRGFPLHRLTEDAREELLNTLFKLTFHRDPAVRLIVYDLIGTSTDFWKSSNLYNSAMGILLLCIGDHNVECIKKVISHLFQLSNTPFRSIVTPLGLVKDALSTSQMQVMKAYDDLANALARERIELKELIDATVVDANVDEFWNFYLHDVPENQLVRPDDYNYTRNFVHAPFWIALLLTKLTIPPPPIASNEATPRDVMPNTPAGKRRFVCGFMLCLLPTCGMPDPGMRRAACICAIRCCFSGFQLNVGIMRGLLEYASQQMLQHKQWTFQVSALDILRFIARLKLPGIAPAILIQYLDMALEVAYNSPSSTIKIGALELIETYLLVFPHGIGSKLPEVRDTIRYLITDDDSDVVSTASRIYPLVFRCVSTTNAASFYEYLRDEITVIEKSGLEAAGDPHVSKLDKDEAESEEEHGYNHNR